MRQEIIHFLQNVEDEEVMAFIFRNFTQDDLLMLYNYLNVATPETKKRWDSMYTKLLHSF